MELRALSKVGIKWAGLSFIANRPGVMVNRPCARNSTACRPLLCIVMRHGGMGRGGSAKGREGSERVEG